MTIEGVLIFDYKSNDNSFVDITYFFECIFDNLTIIANFVIIPMDIDNFVIFKIQISKIKCSGFHHNTNDNSK